MTLVVVVVWLFLVAAWAYYYDTLQGKDIVQFAFSTLTFLIAFVTLIQNQAARKPKISIVTKIEYGEVQGTSTRVLLVRVTNTGSVETSIVRCGLFAKTGGELIAPKWAKDETDFPFVLKAGHTLEMRYYDVQARNDQAITTLMYVHCEIASGQVFDGGHEDVRKWVSESKQCAKPS
jgi:hypothetical protein